MQSLIEEYKASESAEYVQWGLRQEEEALERSAERMAGEAALAAH